jgi:hypothetical protein
MPRAKLVALNPDSIPKSATFFTLLVSGLFQPGFLVPDLMRDVGQHFSGQTSRRESFRKVYISMAILYFVEFSSRSWKGELERQV